MNLITTRLSGSSEIISQGSAQRMAGPFCYIHQFRRVIKYCIRGALIGGLKLGSTVRQAESLFLHHTSCKEMLRLYKAINEKAADNQHVA